MGEDFVDKGLMPDDQNCTQLNIPPKLYDPSQVLLIEDILYHLFSFFNIKELVKMSRVCKVWQIVSRQKIKFASTASFYDPELAMRSGKLMNTSLIKDVLELTDKSLTEVFIRGSMFRGFYKNLEFKELSPEVCQILSDNCPNLTRLSLSSIKMSTIFCSSLGKCLPPNLKTLEIRECYSIEDHNFGKILGNCKDLESLLIDGSDKLEGLSIIDHLKSGQLKTLSLVDCRGIKMSSLFNILKMFKSSLRELYLQCSAIEEDQLGMNSNNLVDFKFDFLETFILRAYDEACDDNERTNLYSNLKLFLNAMPNLKTLKLQYCEFTASNELYFKLLPKRLPLLKELHILNSLPIARKDIYFLSKLGSLEKLFLDGLFDAYYDFNNSNNCDSDDDQVRIGRSHMHPLPDEAKEGLLTHLVSVIIKCPKLNTVIFDDMPMLNDDHVFTMISSMPSLKLLQVYYLSTITGSFVSKCTDLDRTYPIKVELYGHEVEQNPLPAIPSFLELYVHYRDKT